ncbi:hypothetical protein D3C71_1978280 [compost metagenome]
MLQNSVDQFRGPADLQLDLNVRITAPVGGEYNRQPDSSGCIGADHNGALGNRRIQNRLLRFIQQLEDPDCIFKQGLSG